MRAIAAAVDQSQQEVPEILREEEDDTVLLQRASCSEWEDPTDASIFMQLAYDPAIPFGCHNSRHS